MHVFHQIHTHTPKRTSYKTLNNELYTQTHKTNSIPQTFSALLWKFRNSSLARWNIAPSVSNWLIERSRISTNARPSSCPFQLLKYDQIPKDKQKQLFTTLCITEALYLLFESTKILSLISKNQTRNIKITKNMMCRKRKKKAQEWLIHYHYLNNIKQYSEYQYWVTACKF